MSEADRHSSGCAAWLLIGAMLFIGMALVTILVPLVECPECPEPVVGGGWICVRVPDTATAWTSIKCPRCKGTGKLSFLYRWIHYPASRWW